MESELAGAVAAVLEAAATAPASRLCCALSGGVDSVVLLDVLLGLQPRFGFRLNAAHVHHGLSPHADAWAEFCAAYCAGLGVALKVRRVEVVRDHPDGLEAAARRARHAALREEDCDWLVFGHHQDDQAETLLFRLLRGAGVRGAAAMAPLEAGSAARAGRLRPLLGVRRRDILDYAEARGLRWVEDESNADCRFARNSLRHRVMPVVESGFPGAVPTLARAAAHFREASGLLDELAMIDAAACGGDTMRRASLQALSGARAANLLRWQLRRLGVAAPSQARLNEALRQLREVAADQPLYLLLGEAACCAYRGEVWLEALAARHPVAQDWRGEDVLPWGDGVVSFGATVGEGIARDRLSQAVSLRLVPRAEGLKMRLDPSRPRRSFKNLCQEAGIPAWMRARLPVLEVDGRTAWVAGIGVAAEFRCAPGEVGVLPSWQPVSVAQRGEHLGEFHR